MLGVCWDSRLDCLSLPIKVMPSPKLGWPKRALLPLVVSIYDPLGLVVPITVTRIFRLQELWKRTYELDQLVNHELQLRISEWWVEFEHLHTVPFQQ